MQVPNAPGQPTASRPNHRKSILCTPLVVLVIGLLILFQTPSSACIPLVSRHPQNSTVYIDVDVSVIVNINLNGACPANNGMVCSVTSITNVTPDGSKKRIECSCWAPVAPTSPPILPSTLTLGAPTTLTSVNVVTVTTGTSPTLVPTASQSLATLSESLATLSRSQTRSFQSQTTPTSLTTFTTTTHFAVPVSSTSGTTPSSISTDVQRTTTTTTQPTASTSGTTALLTSTATPGAGGDDVDCDPSILYPPLIPPCLPGNHHDNSTMIHEALPFSTLAIILTVFGAILLLILIAVLLCCCCDCDPDPPAMPRRWHNWMFPLPIIWRRSPSASERTLSSESITSDSTFSLSVPRVWGYRDGKQKEFPVWLLDNAKTV